MTELKEAYIGIDVAKLRNAVAIADAGREGEIPYIGEVDASSESMKRLVVKLASKYERLHFCYEAGPKGYGLHGQITELGHACTVVAPSLIPRKPCDRVKTNRRDATALARLLRAGELTAVWVPDPAHEAMRNLIRARTAAVETVRVHKQQVSSFLLRHSRIFPRKKNWGALQSPGGTAIAISCHDRVAPAVTPAVAAADVSKLDRIEFVYIAGVEFLMYGIPGQAIDYIRRRPPRTARRAPIGGISRADSWPQTSAWSPDGPRAHWTSAIGPSSPSNSRIVRTPDARP
jgi:hypothetical protein